MTSHYRGLPNEIILEIIRYSNKATQSSMCRASKLLHDLCCPILNAEVHLEFEASTIGFCSALVMTPQKALLVKRLTLEWMERSNDNLSDLLVSSMSLMGNLEYLKLGNGYDASLHKHFFSDFEAFSSVRIPLPGLEHYEGPSDVVVAFEGGTNLRQVNLFWVGDSEDDATKTRNIIATLASMTSADIPFISHHIREPGSFLPLPLLMSVVENMPQTTVVTLRRGGGTDTRLLTQVNLATLQYVVATHLDSQLEVVMFQECLQQLTHLTFFALEVENNWAGPGQGPVPESIEDRVVISSWSEACPTLRGCSINNRTWRKGEHGTWELEIEQVR
ncbi:hypothetical protein R3P38DRAFT_3183924 [Favolaschia claudopus]|uniref:F-box domain-containing protein n=1 Tax=Favolaschia claudopus TaxID=2862362 RepID=A0AAW0CA66_9AGAR